MIHTSYLYTGRVPVGANSRFIMLCAADRLVDRYGCAERSTKLSTKRSRRPLSIHLLELQDVVQTGDLLLFSSRHAASNLTKCFTASAWDHVGLVVRPCHGFTFVVEWAGPGGIFASPLVERLTDYYGSQGRLIAIRRLSLGKAGPRALQHSIDPRALQHSIETFVERAMAEGLGMGSPSSREIVHAVLAQLGLGRGWQETLSHQVDAHTEARQGLFCSKFVAATYKNAGLLSKHRASAEFLPKVRCARPSKTEPS